MSNSQNKYQKVKELLSRFGLSDKEREIYMLLVRYGWSTVLQLSRKSKIKRATLYRVLEVLQDKGLVEVEVDDKTTHYNAASIKQFESFVTSAEEKTKQMRADLKALEQQLSFISLSSPKDTKVRFYRGKRGLQQMEWRKCRQPDLEILIFGSAQWNDVLGYEFAEKIRAEMVKQDIAVREILNEKAIFKQKLKIDGKGKTTWTEQIEFATKHFSYRVIDEKKISIPQDIYIVGDDTLHFHGYREGDVMGIEIISVDYARMMKQLFEMAWSLAKTK